MDVQFYKIAFTLLITTVTLVHPSNDFVWHLKQINSDLLSYHATSLNYLTDQQSTVSHILSAHNSDVVTDASNAISYIKSLEDQNFRRLNRKADLQRQCWLHNFYTINQLSRDSQSELSNCSIGNINATRSLAKTYFHSMVDTMLYESALGTTNTLYAIGMYNPLSEQFKITKTLDGLLKYSDEGWNGTMAIVDGEVQQIRNGVERIYQKIEECGSTAVQKCLDEKIKITAYMNKCS